MDRWSDIYSLCTGWDIDIAFLPQPVYCIPDRFGERSAVESEFFFCFGTVKVVVAVQHVDVEVRKQRVLAGELAYHGQKFYRDMSEFF